MDWRDEELPGHIGRDQVSFANFGAKHRHADRQHAAKDRDSFLQPHGSIQFPIRRLRPLANAL